ncbi:Leucine-rich repeat receptor-like serine/threonine-protein kinase [Arachis hypogaea]|nr:Leucine-rich repeat receptor-like serine/threonine-protein kinase [Arachis hypogaea]
MDLTKQLDSKAAKQGKKADTFSLVRTSQAPSLLQLKDVVLATAVDLKRTAPRPVVAPSGVSSKSVSPFSRRPSPPRSATPIPTTSGLSFFKSIADSLKRTNELSNQEVQKLHSQRSTKKTQDAMAMAAEESAKCKAAKEVRKSLTAQLKGFAEKLPPGAYDAENIKPAYLPNSIEPNGIHLPDSNGGHHLRAKSISGSSLASTAFESSLLNRTIRNAGLSTNSIQIEAEWIEQYEPGVYITLVALRDRTRDLKRVCFSRRRFGEHQAETWWSENWDKVYERYNVRSTDKSSNQAGEPHRTEGVENWFKDPEYGLKAIDLSRNNLKGEILSEIENLTSLDSLDLSRNDLCGRIPSSLSQIDGIGALDLSYNNLSGRIPSGRHMDTFGASFFEGNPNLCAPESATNKVAHSSELTKPQL